MFFVGCSPASKTAADESSAWHSKDYSFIQLTYEIYTRRGKLVFFSHGWELSFKRKLPEHSLAVASRLRKELILNQY